MKTTTQLLNNVSGQIEGIKKMLLADKSPAEVIMQMKSARSGFDTAINKYIQDNFWEMLEACEDKNEACKKIIADLLSTLS